MNAGAEAASSLLRSVFLLHEMRKELRIKSLLIDALLPDLSIWRADALLNVDSQARHAWRVTHAHDTHAEANKHVQ